MRLITATKDFVIKGRSYPGFPIVLRDTMESCIPVNEFLRYYLMRGRIGSKKGWPKPGRAMYDYFSFLQAHDQRWEDVQRGEQQSLVGAYRDYCIDTAKLANSTVRQSLSYICAFYDYALKQGWVDSLPYAYEDRTVKRDGGFLGHLDASGGSIFIRDVSPKARKDLPKFLSKDEIKLLLDAAVNAHHRMLIRFALQTGLRKAELATFPLAYVFNPDMARRTERNIRILLDPQDGHGIQTKGGVSRAIYVNRILLTDLWFYAIHQRGERAQLSVEKHRPLFLNHRGQPYANDGKGIDRIVRETGLREGIKVKTHMLRHTYATHMLHAMQRAGSDIEPLVFLQQQLGHASIQTTMIYLHLLDERADEAVLAYDDELNEWTQRNISGQA